VNDSLTTKRHVFLLPHGSISLGALNAPKIDILARAIDHVVRLSIREAEEVAAQQLAMEAALAAAKEAAAREEAEAAAQAAREEDTLLMERSIASAMEAQRMLEEEDKRRDEEEKRLEEAVRKAAEKLDIARRAEEILATISAGFVGGGGF
jgi:aspartate aminotransferase